MDKISFRRFNHNRPIKRQLERDYIVWYIYINGKRQKLYSIRVYFYDVANEDWKNNEYMLLKGGGFFLGPSYDSVSTWKTYYNHCIFDSLHAAKDALLYYLDQGY